jgi:hypothetical protein
MFTAIPLVAAAGAGVTTSLWRFRRTRVLPVLVGISVGAAAWFGSILLWIATCSS